MELVFVKESTVDKSFHEFPTSQLSDALQNWMDKIFISFKNFYTRKQCIKINLKQLKTRKQYYKKFNVKMSFQKLKLAYKINLP